MVERGEFSKCFEKICVATKLHIFTHKSKMLVEVFKKSTQ